jgi:hypothetical protein
VIKTVQQLIDALSALPDEQKQWEIGTDGCYSVGPEIEWIYSLPQYKEVILSSTVRIEEGTKNDPLAK